MRDFGFTGTSVHLSNVVMIKRFLCQEDRARLEADCLMILLLDCHDSLNEVLVLRCAQIPLDMIDICPISVFE